MAKCAAQLELLVKERTADLVKTNEAMQVDTGLGLARCYGIVKQSGGHINV